MLRYRDQGIRESSLAIEQLCNYRHIGINFDSIAEWFKG